MQQDQSSTTLWVMLPERLVAMLWLTVGLALIWVASSRFVFMRRRASNLTSSYDATAKHPAPEFLKVDHQARKVALERGEDDDKKLAYRAKAAAAAAAKPGAEKPVTRLARLFSGRNSTHGLGWRCRRDRRCVAVPDLSSPHGADLRRSPRLCGRHLFRGASVPARDLGRGHRSDRQRARLAQPALSIRAIGRIPARARRPVEVSTP